MKAADSPAPTAACHSSSSSAASALHFIQNSQMQPCPLACKFIVSALTLPVYSPYYLSSQTVLCLCNDHSHQNFLLRMTLTGRRVLLAAAISTGFPLQLSRSSITGSAHQDQPVSCRFNKIPYGFSQNLASHALTKK